MEKVKESYLKHYFIEMIANKIQILIRYLQTTKNGDPVIPPLGYNPAYEHDGTHI